MRDIIFLLGFLAMVPVALRNPAIGVMLWAWTALLSPNDYLFGFMTLIPINKVCAALTVFAMVTGPHKNKFYCDKTIVMLAAMILLGYASAANGLSTSPDVMEEFERLAKIGALVVVITMTMTTRLRLYGLILSLCMGLGLNGLEEGLKFIASAGGHKVEGFATIGDNNEFAVAILMLIPLQVYAYRAAAVPLIRLGLWGALMASLVSVVATYSRGGFIGLSVLALLYIATSRNKVTNVLVLLSAALALFFLAPDTWFGRIGSIQSAGEDTSFMTRIIAWKMSLLIAADHPFLGGGFKALQDHQVWASYRPYFDPLAFILTDAPTERAYAAHSIYFQVLGNQGIPGFLLFISLWLTGFANARAINRLSKGQPTLSWAGAIAGLLQGSLLVFAVSGAALSMAYFELYYIILGMLSVLRRLVETEMAARPPIPADHGDRRETPSLLLSPSSSGARPTRKCL